MKPTETQAPPSISPGELQQRLVRGEAGELLDVRTPPEHATVHVPGVRLVPLDELDAEAFLQERAKPEVPLYVFCQAGGRAKKAVDRLRAAGCDNAVLVEGGTEAWIAAGLPVTRGQSKVLPLMRQVQLIVGLLSATGSLLALTVDVRFALVPLLLGCGLTFAGATGWCGLAVLLAKLPMNRTTGTQTTTCPTR